MPQFEIFFALSAVRTTKVPVQWHTCCVLVSSSLYQPPSQVCVMFKPAFCMSLYINTTCLCQQRYFQGT